MGRGLGLGGGCSWGTGVGEARGQSFEEEWVEIWIGEFGEVAKSHPVSVQDDVNREVVTEEDFGKTWGEGAQRWYSNWQIDENALEKSGIKRSGMWKIRPQVTLWLYNSEFQSTHLKVNSFASQKCEIISWHTFVKLEVNSEKHIWIYVVIIKSINCLFVNAGLWVLFGRFLAGRSWEERGRLSRRVWWWALLFTAYMQHP